MNTRTVLSMFLLVLAAAACQQKPIKPKVTPPPGAIGAAEAAEHISEVQTVCGWVANTRYIYWTRGQPTFLNLDQPHPDQIFSVVIWSLDRKNFDFAPEERFLHKTICVTGLIEVEEGIPQIVVSEPAQIEFLKPSRREQPES